MKKVLIGLGVLVILVAVGVFVFLGSLNDIVRAAVEKVGSDMTQTNVTLNEVDIELTSGKGALRGFSVTNPNGFSDDDAFKFDEVAVTLDLTTVRSDPVVVKEVVIQGPDVVYEFGKDGGSNLETLNNNVQSKAGSGGGGSASKGETPNIVIENLYLRDGSVSVIAPLLNEKMSVPLPTIHLKDIGKDGKGATPEEIADQVMAAVLKGAQDAVAQAKIDVEKLTGAAMEEAGKAAGEAQKAIEDATSGAGDIGKDAGDAIKGLIGR
ncbi:MAG: hypothetical protein JJ899_11305 [Alphaproteobacteria bacterium]|nr:hypothetical protein [Alphaproteobacteria bacterium]